MTTLLNINGKQHQIDLPDDTPILWTLRDELGMTGTKFGCGMALCGACTVHLDGAAIRSCVTPIAAAAGKKITTIEAVSQDTIGKSIQDAWQLFGVPQCGYCQSGQIMSATALLTTTSHPSDQQIKEAMSGNICRCGTYTRIHAAIKYAAQRVHVPQVNAPPVKRPAAVTTPATHAAPATPAPATTGAEK